MRMPTANGWRTFLSMPAANVRPFEARDIPVAGALLAARHRRHRRHRRLLSPRYEDPATAEVEVAAAFAVPNASGAVAIYGGELAAFVVGAPRTSPTWGSNVWIDAAGAAATEPAALREAYGLAATQWVEQSRTAHYVLVPASDHDLLTAWYRLGFGQQQAHGYQDSLAECEQDLDNPDYTTFVAEVDGVVIGSSIGCSLRLASSHPPLTRPEHAGFLTFAAVFPHARGLGAGRALGEAVIGWAEQAGYECVVTDWRVTNLLSSRTWPRLGFMESFLRLHRLVGY